MAVVKILGFGGMVPAVDDRLLPDTAAALSQNCYLYTGQLVGMVAPKFVRNMDNANYGKTYRIPKNYYDSEHIENSYWMEFVSIDTDVIRSPVPDDQFDRYYWVSPLESPKTNSLDRIKTNITTPGSTPPYELGLPATTSPPVITIISGGVGVNETRAYVVTWVTIFGEEGPPSLPAIDTGKSDATWNLTLTVPSSADVIAHNISHVRIYRTIATAGSTSYYFVTELVAAATLFADNIPSTTVSANEVLTSTDWTPPPEDLLGWVTMANGMIAGWRSNELWFCEPFRPHAWPAAYTITVEYPIVGLGVTNQSLVVCTAGYPMVATGIHPNSISMSKLAAFEPCMARGSILSAPEGVFYASPNGLVLVANGAVSVVTEGLVQKDEWHHYSKIATLRATRLGSGYYAFGSKSVGFMQGDAFQNNMIQQDDYAGSYEGLYLDNANQRIAFNTLTSSKITTNVFNDPWSGETLLLREDALYRLDLSDLSYPRETALWKSKIFQAPDRKNFAAIRIYFELPPWAPTQNPARDTSEGQIMTADKYGIVRIYADDTLIMTRELRASGELMRLPSGFKADYWQIGLETLVKVNSVQLATSVKELLKA